MTQTCVSVENYLQGFIPDVYLDNLFKAMLHLSSGNDSQQGDHFLGCDTTGMRRSLLVEFLRNTVYTSSKADRKSVADSVHLTSRSGPSVIFENLNMELYKTHLFVFVFLALIVIANGKISFELLQALVKIFSVRVSYQRGLLV